MMTPDKYIMAIPFGLAIVLFMNGVIFGLLYIYSAIRNDKKVLENVLYFLNLRPGLHISIQLVIGTIVALFILYKI